MPTVNIAALAQQLKACAFTHVVWVPDSELGGLEAHLEGTLPLIRACREGEAMATAAGLLIGGARPVVICQCTGFFEAGDAFRNVAKDLGLPLFLVIGHRGAQALAAGRGRDSAARYLEPILRAWGLEYRILSPTDDPAAIREWYEECWRRGIAAAVVIPE